MNFELITISRICHIDNSYSTLPSVKNLPIFIDTPLGRLDEEHRDSITKKYYPSLSEQVVLFSTNSEITPKRFKDISGNISKSYLLFNDGVNTSLKSGYFNTINND